MADDDFQIRMAIALGALSGACFILASATVVLCLLSRRKTTSIPNGKQNEAVEIGAENSSPCIYEGNERRSSPDLREYISANIIGRNVEFKGPFGARKMTYCDYTASGKPLKCLEDYITSQVLTTYGNTHTTTSFTSTQTTMFREESRDIIRQCVGASSQEDAVLFVGSGCTAAIHKLIGALELTKCKDVVVFVGAGEHHSNLLPWRELASQVVRIEEDDEGFLNLVQLETALKAADGILIGCFSAASNITGILNQDLAITALLHRYGALSFWDYATAAPYVQINVNPLTTEYPNGEAYKDAIYFSTHKFIGGVETPGILVAKKHLFRNRVPCGVGGGTVVFVDRKNHRYVQDVETREEGGTPAIVGSIRAGLVFKLKESFTSRWIMEREEFLVQLAFQAWNGIPEISILGSKTAPRLAIFSFLIRHPASGYYLHHNYVCTLLNDLFGIQVRGGCACAGPYAQDLLNINDDLARKYEEVLADKDGYEILKPGFSRLNISYISSEDEVNFILRAVISVAQHGWKLLPYYRMDVKTAEWRHHTRSVISGGKKLESVNFGGGQMTIAHSTHLETPSPKAPLCYEQRLKEGEDVLNRASLASMPLMESPDVFQMKCIRSLRWFLLPDEAKKFFYPSLPLSNPIVPVFQPRSYVPFSKHSRPFIDLRHYSTIPFRP